MEKPILTNETYFTPEANMFYAGSSQIKSFEECEAKTMAELRGEYQREITSALLVGSYVDAHFSNELDLFKGQHPELFKKDGTLKSEYIQADYIINRIERSELLMKYLKGSTQTILTGEIAGVPIKVKLDSYFPDKAIIDLKVVRDFQPLWNDQLKAKQNFVDFWKYTHQAALYQEIVRQNTDKQLPYFIAAATKEKETDIALLGIPQEVLDEKLQIITELLPRIKDLKEGKVDPTRCEKCDYCKFTKELTSIIDYRDLVI